MKKIFALFALMFVVVMPLCLVGCKSKYDNLSIEMADEVEIVLGENENDSITVEARVAGASDDNGSRLSFSPDNEKLVAISQEYKKGTNYITLKALAPGKVNIEARTLEGGVTKKMLVNIIQPIKNFSVKNENFFVLRGGEWSVDVEKTLSLEPANTNQRDFSIGFASEQQNLSELGIEGDVLSVGKNATQNDIKLVITSSSNREISKTITLEVLDEFVEVEEQTSEEYSSGSVCVFEKNEENKVGEKITNIDITSNVVSESTKSIVVRVYSAKNVDVITAANSKLAIKKSTIEASGQGYTDFVFEVRFADVVSSGATTDLEFVVKYSDYAVSKKLSKIQVSYQLAPKELLINDQSDLTKFTLFNSYSTAKKGQKLQFGILPSSVSAANSKMKLVNESDLVDAFEHIQFFRSNGEELFENGIISANEIVYAKAKSSVTTGSYKVVLQSTYDNKLSKVLEFEILAGITSMEFQDETTTNIQLNGNSTAEVLVDVKPANVDISKIKIESVDGLAFSTFTKQGSNEEKTTFKFSVTAEKVGNFNIKIYSENGVETTKRISVINALENVVLSAPNPNEDSVIGDRRIVNGTLNYVAVSSGGGFRLGQSITPSNSKYRVGYSYCEFEEYPDLSARKFEDFNYTPIGTTTQSGVLDYAQLEGFGMIVANETGYSIVCATYTPIGIENNEEKELADKSFSKYFIVESYVPIRSISVSSNDVTLYTLNSVGAYKDYLAKTNISLSINPRTATYASEIKWQYDKNNAYVGVTTNKDNPLTISAEGKKRGFATITATITELNRTYSQKISISVIDAKMVSNIQVQNVPVNGYYVENMGEDGANMTISASAFPVDAFNTKLRYDFVDQSGNVDSSIKFVEQDGIVSMNVPKGVGKRGFVRIAAEDCFQKDKDDGMIKPRGTESENIVKIPTIIANGLSEDTAIEIDEKNKLKRIDPTKHYRITQELDISDINFSNFYGGLYGGLEDNSKVKLITSGNQAFINNLSQGACIKDFVIECNEFKPDIDTAVLVGTNNGTLTNISVNGKCDGQTSLVGTNGENGKICNVTSEVEFEGKKFAGIAFVNKGEIVDCKFMGKITASEQGTGIVISNEGTVDNCEVWILDGNYIRSSQSASANAKIAGVCINNASGGKITRTYVHSYRTDGNDIEQGASANATIVGFVHANAGTIQKCFSAISNDSIVGFVSANGSGAKIENCYSNTTFATSNSGTIKNCYSVFDDARLNAATNCYSGENATNKTVSDWLNTSWDISSEQISQTIWKIYSDAQNPVLNEVVAEVKPDSLTISINEPKSTNSYIKVNESGVVLFYYKSKVSPLSIEENAILNRLNTISILDLLTLAVTPDNASPSPELFKYTLSEGNALEMSGLNIKVLGLGKQTLTITSKLNPDSSATLNIHTSYPIRDFNIFSSTSSFDPSTALLDGAKMSIKRSHTKPLYAKVSNSVVLVDRTIEFETYNLQMKYSSSSDLVPLGLHHLSFDKAGEKELTCSLQIVGDPYGDFDEVKERILSKFKRTYSVVVYNGAENMFASQYSFEMEPIDSIKLDISIKTDAINENLTENSASDIIKYEIFNKTGINLTKEYFSVNEELTNPEAEEDSQGFKTFCVSLEISLKEKTTQVSGDYYIRIYPNEEDNLFVLSPIDISLKLLPQSVQRIDYSHYYAESSIDTEKKREVLVSNSTPSNALAPGQVGLFEINLFPTYSEVSHIEVISVENEGHTVALQLYQRESTTNLNRFVMMQQNANFQTLENGVRVGYTMITNGTIYLKTQISSNIPEEMVFELIIKAYKNKDDNSPMVEQHVFLSAKFIPSATIELEGQKDYAVMGRGTTKDLTITVIGEGDVNIFVDDKTEGTANSYEKVSPGTKKLVEKTNIGTKNVYVYKCPIVVGSMFKNESNNVATIQVVVSREVNGVKEKKTTTLTIRVLDFVVNGIVLTNGTDKFSSKVSVNSKFDFSFDISEPQAFTNESCDISAVAALKQKIESFKKYQYFTTFNESDSSYIYQKEFFYVDDNGDYHSFFDGDSKSYKSNAYIIFEDVFDTDEKYSHTVVKGLKTGTQKMKIIVSATESGKEVYSILYDFDVVVTNFSNEDRPMPIGSLDDFNAIFEQSDAQDYILTNDIEIFDHVINSDTSKIRSLDGNNHKIIIKSLNFGTNPSLEVALFNTINETTTIKNLIVDYQIEEINANSDQFSDLAIAGLALENQGIVTNTHVLSSNGDSSQSTGGLRVSTSVSQSTMIQMAGFVLNNSGSITNSRVGGTSVTIVDTQGHTKEHSLKIFALVGQDQMAGFVLNNSGIISSSYASNITIQNNSNFQENNQTAGFVLNNQANAKIVGSYVRGVENANSKGIYVLGSGIESSFEVAGFVFDNYSYIADCYSNIKLYKEMSYGTSTGLRSAGFVLKNEIGAEIVSCVAMSKIIESNTNQEYFCGVDSENQSNNKGTINYSYYYSENGRAQSVADGSQMLDMSNIKSESVYYGYSFTSMGALDGMWFMSEQGPDLVSANKIALSKRYLVSMDEENYNVAYVSTYEYGSSNNPILIRSAAEFNAVFGTSKDSSIKQYYDGTNKTAFGNYRIINDIDLSDLSIGGGEDSVLSSTSFMLTRKTNKFGEVVGDGVLDGNSMTISNLDFSTTDEGNNFGLFAAATNGAVIKNVDITVKGVAAGGMSHVGALVGHVSDSKIINVSARSSQNAEIAVVQGGNVVGGIVGAVYGKSEINNLSSSISAYASYVDTKGVNKYPDNKDCHVQAAVPNCPSESDGTNTKVSVAGSVAGAICATDPNSSSNVVLSTISSQVNKIRASGKIIVRAKIVGGLIGYVGETTHVHDAWLSICEGQKLLAQDNGVAGGAVGINKGWLSHVRIEHNDVQDYSAYAENDQTEIESNIKAYYTGGSSSRGTYEQMFTPEAGESSVGQTLGGIVGVMNAGMIEDSYTKLDVISDTAYNLGGIVGIVKNNKFEISRVYTFSNVKSMSAENNVLVGGLFGAVLSSGNLNTVVGANYLDKNYTTAENAKQKYVTFAPFAGAISKNLAMTNVFVLSAIWDNDKIKDNTGAKITNDCGATVLGNTTKISFSKLFPARQNAIDVNNTFKIDDTHFKSIYWARNVDDVLPHLTFGVEEQYFIIDDEFTADDLRKIINNSNKTFYIDGRVDLTKDEQSLEPVLKQIRNTIVFTGSLLGIPTSLKQKDEAPTLIGLQELFQSAIGSTFGDFTIENPKAIKGGNNLPTNNFGLIAGQAKDCTFRSITLKGEEDNDICSNSLAPENSGAIVGLAEGKTSFESISISGITLRAKTETNIGLIAGHCTESLGGTYFKNCSIENCSIEKYNEKSSSTSVGGIVGQVDGALYVEGKETDNGTKIKELNLDVQAQHVGGIVGCATGNIVIKNMGTISNVKIQSGFDDVDASSYVGGLVGFAGSALNITQNNDIKLEDDFENDEDAKQFDKISLKNINGDSYLGGIVGCASALSIGPNKGIAIFTPNMDVSGKNVYAGGIAGKIDGSSTLTNVKVNTQGKIKNKTLKIACKGETVAGGLIGETENAGIKNCWSGTDVEIFDVVESSEITFGGIVGLISKANSENSKTQVLNNASYGRFHLDSNTNITTIYAGGIVGRVSRESDSNAVAEVGNNKTLTSLEICRQAKKNHKVNAVVGSTDNISGSDNAYTYQLSLAVESNTKFATNHATLRGVGIFDKDAECGSILNPKGISSDTTIEDGNYYKVDFSSSAITLTFPTWVEGETEKNFVLIGNGETIKVKTPHADTLGSRTIISGVTIEGKFDYDVSASEVEINETTYSVNSNGLTSGGKTYKFNTKSEIGDNLSNGITSETESKHYCEINNFQSLVTIDDQKTSIRYISREQQNQNPEYDIAREGDSYSGFKTEMFCVANSRGKSYVFEENVNNQDHYGTMRACEEITVYYFTWNAGGSYGDVLIAWMDERVKQDDNGDYIGYGGGVYKFYLKIDENDEMTATLTYDNGVVQEYTVNTITYHVIDDEKINVYDKEEVSYYYNGELINITEDKLGDFSVVNIGSQKYAAQIDDGGVVKSVAPILYSSTVTLGDKTYTYKDKVFYDSEGMAVANLIDSNKYVQKSGFVGENNGFIFGVVVKSNYKSSNFGGFVSTNNGIIKYSSMNGQVFNTSSDKDVAGFVLDNNGIIDYCHSTGAVQGSAKNSYSFGVNNAGGTLTNSYTIMLNEVGVNASGKKSVFANNDGTFSNNEYDPIGTEVDCTMRGVSELTDICISPSDVADKNSKITDKFWGYKFEEIKLFNSTIYNIFCNYGYKTLSRGAFENITHLSMLTGSGICLKNGNGEIYYNNPIVIANSRMLSKIEEIGLGKAYVLANNIDLSKNSITKTNWGNIGLNSNDGNGFTGVFDGNNKTISNLVYRNYYGTLPEVEAKTEYKPNAYDKNKNAPSNSEVYGGFFAKTTGATIKNLTLNNIRIGIATNSNVSDSHSAYSGALIAKATDTKISNIKIEASDVNASAQNKSYVGGVVGLIDNANSLLLISDIYIDKSTSIISQNTMCAGDYESSSWVGFDSKDTASGYCAYSGGVAGFVNNRDIINEDSCNILTTSSSKVMQIAYFNINDNNGLIGKDFLPNSFHVNVANNSGAYYRDDFIEVDSSETKTYYSAYSYDGKLCGSHCSYHEACYSYAYADSFTFSIYNYKGERDGFDGPYNNAITQKRGGFVLFVAECYGYNGSYNSGNIAAPNNWIGEWKIVEGEEGYPASKFINGIECYRYGIEETYNHKVYVPTTFIIPKVYYNSSIENGTSSRMLEAGENYHVNIYHKWRNKKFSFEADNWK